MITITIEVGERTAKLQLSKELEHHFLSGGDVDIRIGGYNADTKKSVTVNTGRAENGTVENQE